jgi:hypothetical protein
MSKLSRRQFIETSVLGIGVAGVGALSLKSVASAGAQNVVQGRTIVVAISFAPGGELREEILDPATRAEMMRRFASPKISAALKEKKLPQTTTLAHNDFAPDRTAHPVGHHEHDAEHHPNHTPIVIREGDIVEWRCHPDVAGFDFMVSVAKDETFRSVEDAPNNPFGWELPQGGSKSKPVLGTLVKSAQLQAKIRSQMGYKFSVWAKGKTLDPDIIVE